VRRTDAAVERSWQGRFKSRLEGCRAAVARLARDGALRKDLRRRCRGRHPGERHLFTEVGIVLQRRWTVAEYEEGIYRLLQDTLTSK
jgi:hypothetical protein